MKQRWFDDAFAEHLAQMERRRGRGTKCGRVIVTAVIALVLLWAAKLLSLG